MASEAAERQVFCLKFQRQLPGLAEAPLPGELGQTIYDNISAEAWHMFLDWFRTICCEQRLDLSEPSSDRIFFESLNYFLFRETN